MEKRSEAFARFVVSRLGQRELGSHQTCIELGAGTGRFTPPLIQRFERVYLVEPAPAYAKVLDERFSSERVTVVAGTAEQFLEEWPDSDSVVLCAFHLLHHLRIDQRQSIYRFLKRTRSPGIFVEPNPWNPLILLKILFSPNMRFAEERQYLRLTRSRLAAELNDAGLAMEHYERIVALPPGITDMLLRRKLDSVLRLCEGLTMIPCAASYHSFHVFPKGSE